MNKSLFLIMNVLVFCGAMSPGFAQRAVASFSVEGIGSQSIPLTYYKMTNIVFPAPIKPGIKVSKDILVQKVKGTENVLVLKAARKGFVPTNLSVYGLDGRLYSLELRYEENPAVLNFRVTGDSLAGDTAIRSGAHPVILSGFPVDKSSLQKDAEEIAAQKGFMHHGVSYEKLRLTLRGIYLRDGIMWFSFRLKNHSRIDYSPEYTRCFIAERKILKRTASQEIALKPVYESLAESVPGDSSRAIVMGFQPFTLPKDKKLIIQMGERNGGRLLVLTIQNTVLLKARIFRK